MKQATKNPESLQANREFSFRAIFYGVIIGLMLMALIMYLDAVLGLDSNVGPIASMIGVMLIPLIGGPTNRKEINIMQSCATATTFAAYSLTGNAVPLLMMGEDLQVLPTFVLLLLSDAIGICIVSILRDQFVYDKSLPFPNALMCVTAMDQIDKTDKKATKLIFGAMALSVVISLLQNLGIVRTLADFSDFLPKGMTLGILIMPLMIGIGYVIGSKNALCMMVTALIVCLIEGPIGTGRGWFTDPAEDYFSSLQDFNLPIVIGTSLLAALVPIIKSGSIPRSFRFKKNDTACSDRDYSLKSIVILLLVLSAAMILFCNRYYHINLLPLIICSILSMILSMIAVRINAESGLSAGMALNVFILVIAYALTDNAIYATLIAFMNFNTFILAQDTMSDLKIGQEISSSPLKLVKAQFIGIIFGCAVGIALFYAIIQTFGLNDDMFTFPFANMYYAVISGISDGNMMTMLNPGRLALGGVLGTVLSFIGLPAGGIALAMYLAPKTIMGLALGGVLRFIAEKTKGHAYAEKLDNAATGMVIGDALVCIIMVVITVFTL